MSEFNSTPRLVLLPAVDVADGKAVRLTQGEAGTRDELRRPRRRCARTGPARVPSGSTSSTSTPPSAAATTTRVLQEGHPPGAGRERRALGRHPRRRVASRRRSTIGATRINLGTAALENPEWAANVIGRYGDAIAVGLDVRGTTLAARGWTQEGGDLWAGARPPRRRPDARATSSPTSRRTARSRARTSTCCAR